ncbi:Bug family tripartite tricarboxylate transporter substrate binding protein [Rhodoplanes sp. Z2-YC6860]|uniref:Bug family tripartite tricarboxylate transporter substrate binding protein n=1 Tax=Rhodoplanes sp. Z2-YC6860 TaxID=674703 RepID=UPI0018DCBEC7|nr:tripartite tricarboxylate transporter substrate binding protein [Rhodoplanes sp. Z2-YC6860]
MKTIIRVAALVSVTVAVVVSGVVQGAAQTADDFPNRPIRIIVVQAPGSGTDLVARLLAQKMGELWGQQGVVENRQGANGIIGVEAAARATPDGYTLLYASISALTTNQFIYKKLPYNTLRDFAPITQAVLNSLGAVASPASGLKSLADVVARAKADPGALSYGSSGIGNQTHQMGVLLSLATNIKMTHVPYRGQTPMLTDVMSGQIPLGFTTTSGVTDLVNSGKLTMLATFGDQRDEQFPNVPTPSELGYKDVVITGWTGLLAPAGTPPAVVNKIYAGMTKVLAMPDVKEATRKLGTTAKVSDSPEAFARFIKAESEKYYPVIKAAGLEGSQ